MSQNDECVVQILSGAGGLEASLFADEIFQMYQGFASFRRWSFEQIEYNKTEIGGIRVSTNENILELYLYDYLVASSFNKSCVVNCVAN